MLRKNVSCPHCGAPTAINANQCHYCGADFHEVTPVADFGLQGVTFPLFGLLIAAAVYGIGWFFEDIDYWLDDRAIAIWAGGLPLCLLAIAFFWQTRRGQWLIGFLVAVLIFVVHLAAMSLLRENFNDDYAGIAGMFAGASLAGWVIGRGLHNWLRRTV